jgi:phosphoglycerol transferase
MSSRLVDAEVRPRPFTAADPTPLQDLPGDPRGPRSEWKFYGIVWASALLIAGLVLQLWRAAWNVPFLYEGDALFHLSLVKRLIEGAWYLDNPTLGAPFGQVLHDMSLGADNAQLLALKALGLLFGDAATAVNVYYVLTFPLIAFTAVFVLRRWGFSRTSSAVAALLFAFLPYHFVRNEGHLLLSGYFSVPLGIYLAVAVLRDEPLFRARHARGRPRRLWGTALGTVGLCVLIASSSSYYAPFTALLVVVAAVVGAFRSRSLAPVKTAAGLLVILAVTLGTNLAPSLLWRQEHGPNDAVVRKAHESEHYGLKPAQLVLPRENHRLDGAASMTAQVREGSPVPSEPGQSLGLIGGLGLLALGVVAVGSLGGRLAVDRRLGDMALLALVTIGIGTVGGGSILIAEFATPQIRAWNRLSLYVAFLSLVAVAAVLDGLRRSRPDERLGMAVLAGICLAIGVFDQTSPVDVPRYSAIAHDYRRDGKFVAELESRLPAETMVFQLPLRSFPETFALGTMQVSDHLRPYLHSKTLRWSFGAMVGREEDWQATLAGLTTDALADRLAAVGFAGVLVDTAGYPQGGPQIHEELAEELGSATVADSDSRQLFFPLEDRRRDLISRLGQERVDEIGRLTVHPVRVRWHGVRRLGSDPSVRAGYGDREVSIELSNTTSTPRHVRIRADVTLAAPAHVSTSGGSHPSRTYLEDGSGTIDQVVTVPPGTTTVEISTDAPAFPWHSTEAVALPGGELHLRFADVLVVDEDAQHLLR